jgi:hypothetical protein
MKSARRCCAAVGVAAVATGVIAPVTAPLPGACVPDIALTAGGDDAQDIVLDFVRHAQTNPSSDTVAVASQGLPGFPLSDTGVEQAHDVGNKLHDELGDSVAGIFGGQEQRMVETAAPFDKLEGMTMQPLSEINEIGGGIYAQDPPGSPGLVLYELTTLAWVLGLRLVPMPASNDYNGVQFEENFGSGVDSIYDDTAGSGVISANGDVTDVAFSGEGAISTWVLMNVENPDVSFFVPRFIDSLTSGEAQPFLSNAGVVEVKGNPDDGWTLVSFDGQDVPQDPDLLTSLIVDVRDLITPPQTAAYDIFEAALTGDATKIEDAFDDGLHNVGSAIVQFPQSVIDDIGDAVQNLGTDTGAAASDGTDSPISDALASLF